ncbi:Short-chain dehydrogenase sdnK [Pseudocercospora fuligena]|uniref:Short-chain dehydrogenase sdnK n=1 Tax=Pseudocercospora fuligena TaxID=685502 RepID=A0A8H6RRB1_9PEZI|nr:Short-chain dehydrogenase sdnK [Pseudocercospora fuligena]
MPSFQNFLELIRQKLYPPKDIRPSFSGRTALITGANKGIGFEAALKLVESGCEHVILGVRSLKSGENAKVAIEQRTGRTGVIQVWCLDMSNYESITAFAERVGKELERLDFAILNVGISSSEFRVSVYGWEETLQVNVLSTALLAILLLPKLKASRTSDFTPVLELVGSSNHYEVEVTEELMNSDRPLHSCTNQPQKWSTSIQFNQYSWSKLFLMYVQDGLVQPLESDKASPVSVLVVCPGVVFSDMSKAYTAWYMPLMVWISRILIMKPAEQGARTYISGLTLGEEGHGKFWQADRFREIVPQLDAAENRTLQQKVWGEIVESLREDVAEVRDVLERVQERQNNP